MTYNKKLSIITICYNEPYLEKTCESIVNQTWQDFEWIVIDGGSNEQTQKVFDKYKYRINKFVSEPDEGIYNAMNKGLKFVTGEYIHFLNAGDYYFNNDVLLEVFEKHFVDSDIIHGNLYISYNYPRDDRFCITSNTQNITPEFFKKNMIFQPASFINSKMFFENEGFKFNEQYKIVSDLEMWLEFAKRGARFLHIPITVSIFNSEGISENPKYREIHIQERNLLFNKYKLNDNKIKYKPLEQIFSVKNSQDKKYKIITIFGVKLKIKRKYRKQ